MKTRVATLSGAALDWAVAKARGYLEHSLRLVGTELHFSEGRNTFVYKPSSRWDHGGPILAETITEMHREQSGEFWAATDSHAERGATLLEAAMRAYVGAALGEEIEMPELFAGKEPEDVGETARPTKTP